MLSPEEGHFFSQGRQMESDNTRKVKVVWIYHTCASRIRAGRVKMKDLVEEKIERKKNLSFYT